MSKHHALLPSLAIAFACTDAVHVRDAARDAERLRAIETVRIDGMASDLVPIGGVVVLPDGTIAVAQPQDLAIRFFTEAGASLGSVGRRGAGPGEFNSVGRMGLVGDTVWVSDARLGRVTFINPDRSLGRTTLMPAEGVSLGGRDRNLPTAAMSPLALYPDQTFLAIAFGDAEQTTVVRANIEDGEGRVLAILTRPQDRRRITTPDGTQINAHVFPAPSIYAVSQQGEVFAHAIIHHEAAGGTEAGSSADDMARFTVAAYEPGGDTAFHRTYEVLAHPIPRSTVDSAIEARAGRLPPHLAAAFRRGAYVPPFWRPITSLVIAADGTMWVQLHDPNGATTYVRLDARGNVTGRLILPRNTTIAAARDQTIWCLERDANDVESIVRYRVE